MKILWNNRAFTLIEMMIVLLIISTLLLIAVPNMTKSNSVATSKGCDATVDLLQTQVGAYAIENEGNYPTDLDTLETEGYVSRILCPNGSKPDYNNADGKVTKNES